MPTLALAIPRIPPVYGVVVALVLLALLIQKEIRRAVASPNSRPGRGAPVLARRWNRVENWLIGLLLGLYGLILLARLISFLP